MKRVYVYLNVVAILALVPSSLFGQGAAVPLSLQGLDQRNSMDVRSRGMGGAIIASGTRASVLFANPAGLTNIQGFEFRAAATHSAVSQEQRQEWFPNRLWTGLSLLMEDKWGNIKAPTDTNGNPIADPYEQLQKPFDNIGPNWSRKFNHTLPLSIALAMPAKIGDIDFVFGIGGSRALDLDHYFQNNNVTDPLLGQYRPQPIPEPTPRDTLRVRWFQFIRERTGQIWGVTPAVGVSFSSISLGASATYYNGTSDDVEQRHDRGFLTLLYNRFRVQDTVKYESVRSGSSKYTGFSGLLGLAIKQPRFTIAATIQLPFTMTRDYSGTFQSREEVLINRARDSVRTTTVNSSESGTEKIRFPLSYSFGLLLKPIPEWSIVFDYDMRLLNKVDYTPSGGSVVQPWLGAPSFRFGAEYQANSSLALRAGYREAPQAFSPEGAALIGDPASAAVYTAGVGLKVFSLDIDIAYEFERLKFQDSWQSNVNYNNFKQHRVVLGFGYRNLEETK